jgi:hypothetical protein
LENGRKAKSACQNARRHDDHKQATKEQIA